MHHTIASTSAYAETDAMCRRVLASKQFLYPQGRRRRLNGSIRLITMGEEGFQHVFTY